MSVTHAIHHENNLLAACRRETSEVSKSSFADEVTLIIRPVCQRNYLQKLPKSKKSSLSDNLLAANNFPANS
jgi:hypothetical protein